MRFMLWNVALATWLLVSAFALPHTPFSQATTWLAGIAVGVAATVAVAKPGARLAISGIAVFLGVAALLVPEMSTAAAMSNAVVAALLFALSVVQPTHAAAEPRGGHAA